MQYLLSIFVVLLNSSFINWSDLLTVGAWAK
jgi:hypothetical protein